MRTGLLWIGILAASASVGGSAYGVDLQFCRGFFRLFGAPVHRLEYKDAEYTKAREFWAKKLDGLAAPEQGKVVLKEMQAEASNHPLSLMALMDHLNGNPQGHFATMVGDMQSAGFPLVFRNYPNTHRLNLTWSKGVHWVVKKIQAKRNFHFPLFTSTKGRVTLGFPKHEPKDAVEAMDRIVSLTAAVAFQRLALVARESPLRSHPLPGGKYSFPSNALKAMHEAEVHIYTTLKAMERLFPDAKPTLSKRDGIWKWKRTQMALDMLIRPFYPWYRPDKRIRPNELTYAKFLEDLEAGQNGVPLTQKDLPKTTEYAQSKFQSRFQLKWFTDRYFSLLKGAFLIGAGVTAFRMAWGLYDNEFEVLPVPVPVGPSSGEPTRQELLNWIQYYEQALDHLEELKESQGDTDGHLEAEIKGLELELNRLREKLAALKAA